MAETLLPPLCFSSLRESATGHTSATRGSVVGGHVTSPRVAPAAPGPCPHAACGGPPRGPRDSRGERREARRPWDRPVGAGGGGCPPAARAQTTAPHNSASGMAVRSRDGFLQAPARSYAINIYGPVLPPPRGAIRYVYDSPDRGRARGTGAAAPSGRLHSRPSPPVASAASGSPRSSGPGSESCTVQRRRAVGGRGGGAAPSAGRELTLLT